MSKKEFMKKVRGEKESGKPKDGGQRPAKKSIKTRFIEKLGRKR